MSEKNNKNLPLDLPDQVNGEPTAPVDRGDETQDRFRYQWAMGAILLIDAITHSDPSPALWCEYHDDFLIELSSGLFTAVQVKTDGSEGAVWRVSDDGFVRAMKRFCRIEEEHGSKVVSYQFCSNAPPYVPGQTALDPKRISESPERIRAACKSAVTSAGLAEPYLGAFQILRSAIGSSDTCLHSVFCRLQFRQGPPLRGYLEWMIDGAVSKLPGCTSASPSRLRRVRDELIRIVETASGITRADSDSGLAYLASNGRPEASLRGKCITLEAALATVEQAKEPAFRYVGGGLGLPIGRIQGQRDVLHRKMRNAYLSGNFESVWMRALSAERRLLERAVSQPDDFEGFLNQLEGVVLVECQDAEALGAIESDELKRGPTILRDVLQRLTKIAGEEPVKVEHEPKETLIGVAGMLSATCRFAWGAPIEDESNGI
jgi:hypothetical protein